MVLLLELVRGLSALWVALFHLEHLIQDAPALLIKFFSYGYLGVAMFFVVSGYVITLSAESSRSNNRPPTIFLRNRFLRIYPAFWCSVVVVAGIPFAAEGLSALKTGEFHFPRTFITTFDVADWIKLLSLTQVFEAESFDLYAQFKSVNAVYWSLAIEFQFYLVIFLGLYLGKYYRWYIAIVSVVCVALMYFRTNLNYGLFVHHWPAFAVGVAVAYMHKANWRFTLSRGLSTLVFPVLYVLGVFVVYRLLPQHYNRLPLAFAVGVAGFLWFFADAETFLQAKKRSGGYVTRNFLQLWLVMGAMSYSVYLLHLKVFLLPEMVLRQIMAPEGPLFALLTLLATLALCYPFYYFIERRFLSSNYKKIHKAVLDRG